MAETPATKPMPAAAHPLPYGRKPLRTFALVVALPIVLLYVASATLVLIALSIMADSMNRQEDAREVVSVHAALDAFLDDLAGDVADEGTWNEAHLNVVVNSSPAWMDSTWGATARIGDSYDTVIVTDAAGNIQYGENNAGEIKGNIADRLDSAATMLADLDKGIAATGDATTVSHFTNDAAGPLGLAAISVHQTTPGQMDVPRQQRRVLWLGKHLVPTHFQELTVRYQIPLLRLVSRVPKGYASYSLADAEGDSVATVAWMPDRPGDTSMRPAMAIAFVVFFVIGALLVTILGAIRRAIVKRVEQFAVELATPAMSTVLAEPVAADAAAAEAKTAADEPSVIADIRATEFTVDYQPVFDLRAEAMVGVEALLRWHALDKSLLAQESLSAADCATMMDRVAVLAIRFASAEIAPLLGLTLALTVSANQIRSGVFAEKMAATLGVTNLPSRRLELDLDATLAPDIVDLAPSIARLRQAGISVALSNFTLSPATIDFIRGGLIDRVRLAPAMVAQIDTDPLLRQLVEASIAAARAAGLTVVAPGIKQRKEAVQLLRMGVSQVQGDVFAPAMPLAPLTSLVLAPAHASEVRQAS